MDEDYDIINLHPYDISVQELLSDNGDDAKPRLICGELLGPEVEQVDLVSEAEVVVKGPKDNRKRKARTRRVNIPRPDGRRSLSRQSRGANEEPAFKKRKKKAENREDVMEHIFGDLWSRSMEGGLESNNEELESNKEELEKNNDGLESNNEELENDKEEVSDANVQEGLSDG